jgi:hypothetical protein
MQQTTQSEVQVNKNRGDSQGQRKITVHRLDYEGLVQVAELIEQLRQKRCAWMGENETKYTSKEDYDEARQTQVKGSSEEQR